MKSDDWFLAGIFTLIALYLVCIAVIQWAPTT